MMLAGSARPLLLGISGAKGVGELSNGEDSLPLEAGNLLGGQATEQAQVVLRDRRCSALSAELALLAVLVQDQWGRLRGLAECLDLPERLLNTLHQGAQ